MKDIKSQHIQTVGFYGGFDECVNAACSYLQVNYAVKFDKIKEGLIALKRDNKLALIFKTDEKIYNYINGTVTTNQAVSYIRYLVDLCGTIIIAPPKDFKFNNDLQSPNSDFINPGYQIKEIDIPPEEKDNIKLIERLMNKNQ